MKSDSLSALKGGEVPAAEVSSTRSSDWACNARMPFMTAGSVRPRRFCSTRLLENICFLRELESINLEMSIKDIQTDKY